MVSGVRAGTPCIYIERLSHESLVQKFPKRNVSFKTYEGVSLNFFTREINGKLLRFWDSSMEKQHPFTHKHAREFRIAILNNNAFRETLHYVFKCIQQDLLLPKRDTASSKELNRFLQKCFSKYLKPNNRLLESSDYEQLVLSYEDVINGGERITVNLFQIVPKKSRQ